MDDQSLNDLARSNRWMMLCQGTQSHGMLMAQHCQAAFADLVIKETQAFCQLNTPESDAEYDTLFGQSQALRSKIGTIIHVDLMARTHPRVAGELFDLVRQFCSRVPLTGDVYRESAELSSAMSSICFRDLMQRFRT